MIHISFYWYLIWLIFHLIDISFYFYHISFIVHFRSWFFSFTFPSWLFSSTLHFVIFRFHFSHFLFLSYFTWFIYQYVIHISLHSYFISFLPHFMFISFNWCFSSYKVQFIHISFPSYFITFLLQISFFVHLVYIYEIPSYVHLLRGKFYVKRLCTCLVSCSIGKTNRFFQTFKILPSWFLRQRNLRKIRHHNFCAHYTRRHL
jgi:hypothetical protein